MDIKSLKIHLGEDFKRVEDLIRESLKSDINLLNQTNESILSHSGKMMRPQLSLLIARACGGGQVTDDSVRFASAAELLHNATLLHDDVADDSKLRRGVPTVLSLLGAQASVLLGDFWLVKAMENILSADKDSDRVTRIFSRTLSDLAEGEMLQLQKASSADTDYDDYIRIIYSKTASLFVASALSAAISVGATEEQEQAAVCYARNLGLAFQIKDDIFDYSEDTGIGKPIGIDLQEQKITLPLLGALAKVDTQTQQQIRSMVRNVIGNADIEKQIRLFVKEQDGVGSAKQKLQEFITKAIDSLDAFPQSEDKDYLVAMAKYVGDRTI